LIGGALAFAVFENHQPFVDDPNHVGDVETEIDDGLGPPRR
jgi:hypothetical protein